MVIDALFVCDCHWSAIKDFEFDHDDISWGEEVCWLLIRVSLSLVSLLTATFPLLLYYSHRPLTLGLLYFSLQTCILYSFNWELLRYNSVICPNCSTHVIIFEGKAERKRKRSQNQDWGIIVPWDEWMNG